MDNEAILSGVLALFENPFVRALTVLVIIIVAQLIAKAVIAAVVPRLVRDKRYQNKQDEKKREDTLASIFQTAAGFIIWIVGILLILAQLEVNIAALATGAGLIGIVVGFGAQKLIQDFLSGVFITIEHQYRIGDYITLDAGGTAISGTVEDFTLRITRLRDLDGNLHVITNGSSITATNYTVKYGNVNVDIRVSYDADIDFVEKIINEEGRKQANAEKWKDIITEPVSLMWVNSLDESSVSVKAFGRVKTGQQWDVASDLRRRLKKAFEKNGINIPYPQMTIHQAGDGRANQTAREK